MDLSIFDFYRNTMEKSILSIFVNICGGGNRLKGPPFTDLDLEFVKFFTPARFQILNLWGRSGKGKLVDLSILSHILKYCHILSNIVNIVEYCRILSNIVKDCQILSNIVKYCQILSILSNNVKYCHILSNIVTYYQILSHIVKYCHILSNIVTNCQILSHIVKYCHILSNICRGGLEKWTCQSCQ